MNARRLVWESLRFHWRVNLAVALGVMAGTAVLTGALLVGDSVRGSLRDLTYNRLGAIDEALVAPTFFRAELANELAAQSQFQQHFEAALPAIFARAGLTYEAPAAGGHPAAAMYSGAVNVIAADEGFWKLDPQLAANPPGLNEVVLNQQLADELSPKDLHGRIIPEQRIKPGDEILLKVQQANQVNADSVFGRKTGTVETRRLTVTHIIPTEGLGRFGLYPNQQLPSNAFTSLGTLQSLLNQRGRVNAILVTGKEGSHVPPSPAGEGVLNAILHPTLDDYGIKLERTRRGYYNLTTNRMIFDDVLESAALSAYRPLGGQPALTYLANWISAGPKPQTQEGNRPAKESDAPAAAADEGEEDDKPPFVANIPYSTVTGLEFATQPPLGPWKAVDGRTLESLADDEIVLNQWAFDDLRKQMQAAGRDLKVGDEIYLTYFEPEHNPDDAAEGTTAFKLVGVVPLDESSPARDADFTPDVPGVTDQASIDDWDPPFLFYPSRVRQEDDDYWEEYRATPKAFVSLATAQKLWGTARFGRVTSLRIPPTEGLDEAQLAARLRLDPAQLGFRFQPVKQQGLQAATGTTPFSVLFISFSFFIIVSAVTLVALLFRLGIENRANQIGVLLAQGFTAARVRKLLAAEGLMLAIAGGLLGTATGAAYAWLMLYGLRTWWVEAISTPFLTLHVTPLSLVLGFISGVAVSFLAIWWTLRRMRHLSVRRLLAGQAREEQMVRPSQVRWSRIIGWACLAAAVGLVAVAVTSGGEGQAGAFFGSGAAALIGGLALLWGQLRLGATRDLVRPGGFPLARLAARNGARQPGRSTLTIGLVAAATFLIAALSVFRIDPGRQQPRLDSGNGGFALVAEAATPIARNLNEPAVLEEEGGLQADETASLADVRFWPLRVLPGEDASCRNLYQTTRPRILGVSQQFIDRGGFDWAGSLAQQPADKENPWRLLNEDAGRDAQGRPYVPVIMDMNTAMYSLHLYSPGATMEVVDDRGRVIPIKLVGMLRNSILQGDILMDEDQFLRLFPHVAGYRFFLIESPTDKVGQVETMLETALANYGFDVQTSGQRLAGYLAVQNTYLSTFQSLGALGLLLGTFGLATVQLRNVFERRAELALLRATGFRRSRLARLVMTENTLLLAGGLLLGTIAAAVAVLPHILSGGASVPWLQTVAMLAAIFVVGFAAGLIAVRVTLKAPLIQALRGD